MNKEFLNFLDDRASVRSFNTKVELSHDTIYDMLHHASYAPSNNNFQPWRVLVIKNKEKQAYLRHLAGGQEWVEKASAVFILFGDRTAYNLDWWQDFHMKHHLITKERLPQKLERMRKYFSLQPQDSSIEGLRLDVGLFAMNLMHVIRAYGFDSVPMRGVDFKAIKDIFPIPNTWEPILLLPVGKAMDNKAHPIKSRREVKEFVKIID